ncbi:MAG: EamA family transporter [Flavobacteriales bacterium]|nr:EamA family transporter [Flavobacteriales bacterium]
MDFSKKSVQWMTLVGLAILWGSSFLLMKRGLESFDNISIACYRIFVSSLVLLPLALKHLKKLFTNKYFLPLLVVGLLGNAIPAFLFTKAQTKIDSSLAGMLNCLVPIFTFLIGVVVFKLNVKRKNFIGILIGLIGVIALLYFKSSGQINGDITYSLFVVVATICYAISVNVIKVYLQELEATLVTGLAFLCVGPLAGVLLFTSTDFMTEVQMAGALPNLGYVTFLAIFCTALAVVIFNQLIKHTSALFASSVTYMIPVVAIVWGAIDGEAVGWFVIPCILAILYGVRLVNS